MIITVSPKNAVPKLDASFPEPLTKGLKMRLCRSHLLATPNKSTSFLSFCTSIPETLNLEQTKVWLVHWPCNPIVPLVIPRQIEALVLFVKYSDRASGFTRLYFENPFTD